MKIKLKSGKRKMTKKEESQIKDIDLIRKIVWSFHKSTRKSFDDLFQEGYIGYMHAIKTYDPDKSSFSTHAWNCISCKILDYLKKEKRITNHVEIVDDLLKYDSCHTPSTFLENLPQESIDIAMLIFMRPKPFVTKTKQKARQQVYTMLKNDNWSKEKIKFGINCLTQVCHI
jgi:RNA polymerase sigma factor (sigma-70 family)